VAATVAAPSTRLVVGIAGGSGSGKTTVAAALFDRLPAGTAAVLEHDAYYRDRSGLPAAERALVNFDHPDALETELLVSHLGALRAIAQDVRQRVMDHQPTIFGHHEVPLRAGPLGEVPSKRGDPRQKLPPQQAHPQHLAICRPLRPLQIVCLAWAKAEYSAWTKGVDLALIPIVARSSEDEHNLGMEMGVSMPLHPGLVSAITHWLNFRLALGRDHPPMALVQQSIQLVQTEKSVLGHFDPGIATLGKFRNNGILAFGAGIPTMWRHISTAFGT
jgi:hypothetical protein